MLDDGTEGRVWCGNRAVRIYAIELVGIMKAIFSSVESVALNQYLALMYHLC